MRHLLVSSLAALAWLGVLSLAQTFAAPNPDQSDKPNFSGSWALDLTASTSLDPPDDANRSRFLRPKIRRVDQAYGYLGANWRFGRGFLTMKWSHRIAHGFSPGWTSQKTALKVATEWGRLFQHDHPKFSHRSKHPALIQRQSFGRHFQGDLGVLPHPGLKALGYSVRPFHGQELASAPKASHRT